MTIRVILVDDSTLFRLGVMALISAHDEYSVVAHVGSGREAVHATLDCNPNVVLMDVVLSGFNVLPVVSQIKRHHPQVKIVMLTAFGTEDYVRAALRAGADGYVLKDASFDELLLAIRSVAKGMNYLSPDISKHVVRSYLHPERANDTMASRLEILTRRERSVLQLVAEGRTNRGAAEFLSLSPKTVEKHRATLMHKLGLRNAAELTLVAVEMGLVKSPFALSHASESSTEGGLAT
jgi:DNA-binding NarL/FixJ family response regulator